MAFKCPDCGATAYTRTSRMMSILTRETYYQCSNLECGATFKSYEQIAGRLSPSAKPNPYVHLPYTRKSQPPPDARQMDLLTA